MSLGATFNFTAKPHNNFLIAAGGINKIN